MFFPDRTTTCLNLLIAVLLVHNWLVRDSVVAKWDRLKASDQLRITEATEALDDNGRVLVFGWSSQYLNRIDFAKARPRLWGVPLPARLQLRKMDCFLFFFRGKVAQVHLAHLGHSFALLFHLYSFEEQQTLFWQSDFGAFYSLGRSFPDMADNPFDGHSHGLRLENADLAFQLTADENPAKNTFLTELVLTLKDGSFKAKLVSERFKSQEDFYEVYPTSADRSSFVAHFKGFESVCEGYLSFGGKYHNLMNSNCVSLLSQSRGFHPRKSQGVWAAASGRLPSGSFFSLNLGQHSHEPGLTASSEDFFKTDGVVQKLSPIAVDLDSRDELGRVVLRTVEKFRNSRGKAEVLFSPQREHVVERKDLLFSFHKRTVFGLFQGYVITDKGVPLNFEGIPGFVELSRYTM